MAICDAQNTLFENAAFIPKDIYNDYYELDIKTNAFFWKMQEKNEFFFRAQVQIASAKIGEI